GWGSRGVSLGSDLAHAEWEKRIENALATFDSSPTIMQRFHKGRLLEHRYWDPDSSELKTMKGRVRLCPYYFVEQDKVKLRVELRASWTKGREHWLVNIQVARAGFFIAPNSPAFDNDRLIQVTDAVTRQQVPFRLRHEKQRMARSIDLAFPELQKPMNVFVTL